MSASRDHMSLLIPDTTADARLEALEQFLVRHLGPRRPEYGASESELQLCEMPGPLRRFFRFAGRWPGHEPLTPFANRFCMQDTLCALRPNSYAPTLRMMDDLLVFVWENQGVWVAATKSTGDDPPVWVTEDCSHREPKRKWRELEKPFSHFLVSFALQEVMFGSKILAAAPDVIERFRAAAIEVEPVWLDGEYIWGIDRPSFFLADGRILIRHAPNETDGDAFYGCDAPQGEQLLKSLGLPTEIG
jgi:hypothetical protein